MALPGREGNRAEELLAEAKRAGTATLADVMRSAVERLLAGEKAGGKLFDDAERAQLAHVLGATLATANLLGRSRIRERQRRAEAGMRFADDVQAFADFADPIPLLSPQAAVNYFRNLVPELGTDPKRFGRDMRRQAFTLAEATEERLVAAVQDAIAERLETGTQRALVGDSPDVGRVNFVRHPKAPAGAVAVLVDPARFDEAWATNEDYYIPPGGGGAEIAGRRREFARFLQSGQAVEAPIVSLAGAEGVDIEDGRHRFSLLRDLGINQVPVMVSKAEAESFRERFGSDVPPEASQLSGPQAVQQLLDQAGVSPQNPGYAELVFRTNAMDAYNTGSEEERQDPDVIETFPVWLYSNPNDGRSRESHAKRNGNYYAAEVSFFTVRGTAAEDVIQCRCVPIPVSKYEWKDLRAAGARLTRA